MEALETILARATVPILRQVEERPLELVAALLPSLIRTMLAAFVEVMTEQRASAWTRDRVLYKTKRQAEIVSNRLDHYNTDNPHVRFVGRHFGERASGC